MNVEQNRVMVTGKEGIAPQVEVGINRELQRQDKMAKKCKNSVVERLKIFSPMKKCCKVKSKSSDIKKGNVGNIDARGKVWHTSFVCNSAEAKQDLYCWNKTFKEYIRSDNTGQNKK